MMLSRRALLGSALAATAVRSPPAWPQKGPAPSSAPVTVLQLERRTIEVSGKPATVFGIRQPDGTYGITTEVGKRFRVRVENNIDAPSLIHWHGLTPPWQQDGVPGISGPPIPAGGNADYDFPLRFGGTFWMHSHEGLQEQSLMLAPLIIHDGRGRGAQEVVVMLNDFSFTPPEQIFADLKKGGSMPNMARGAPGMAPAGAATGPDLNDVKYDAFLANDRTLADPEVVKVEPGGKVLLRIINGSSMSNFHLDLGQLTGELIAVDGFRVVPTMARRFPHCARPGDGRDRRTRFDARSRAPLAGGRTAKAAQAGPRSHPQSDRGDGRLHLVDQQRRLEQGRPAIARRRGRACPADHGQPHPDAAPDAPTRP